MVLFSSLILSEALQTDIKGMEPSQEKQTESTDRHISSTEWERMDHTIGERMKKKL